MLKMTLYFSISRFFVIFQPKICKNLYVYTFLFWHGICKGWKSCILHQKNIAGNICQKRSNRHFLPCMMSIWFFFMLKTHVFIQKNIREGRKSPISAVFFVAWYFSKPSHRESKLSENSEFSENFLTKKHKKLARFLLHYIYKKSTKKNNFRTYLFQVKRRYIYDFQDWSYYRSGRSG